MPSTNLFDYATSELSQDAFICWLAANYNSEDALVRRASQSMLRLFLGRTGESEPVTVEEVHKQWNDADVLLLVSCAGRRSVIVVEDKVFSGPHGDQLTKYRALADAEFSTAVDEVRVVYYKTTLIVEREYVASQCEVVVDWKQIQSMLADAFGKVPESEINPILRDYYQHVQSLNEPYEQFRTLPLKEWQGNQFCGFFDYLLSNLRAKYPDWRGGYGNNNNQNGGHWTLWFGSGTPVGADARAFHVNIESPSRLVFETSPWVCRVLVRWDGDEINRMSRADLNVPMIKNLKVASKLGKHTILDLLFEIPRDSEEANQGYTELEARIYEAFAEYEQWCRDNQYEA